MADNNTNTVINMDTARMTEKQKVKEITDKLEEGLKELFESEKYKSYLSTMSKFHNYSFNNIQLIAMQKPDATLVAGYKAWQKNFERHVNKGEKAIRILAPAPYKIREERDKLDPVTGEMMFDENGMPQREEVEVKIPAFRVVSVFDVSQTDGKPIPELETQELLSTVERYEDFVQALMNVAPVPIGFEDIPGDSKGYFHTEEKRIAVQENMSESQTLKTMVHEVAHSMLHNKEVNRDNVLGEPVKDRNTKEVEAESIAYTVCQHFGIDTSDYSFGYIAGWSSGKDMKELKSSLDTIRKTASELISGIEGQLQELQINREMEQTQDITLLIRNNDLSEYDLLNVRGMESTELTNALLAMNDDDRLSVTAYLESKGAWVTPLADEQTEEVGEYHLDYAYNTDTLEITDFKALREMEEKANQPIDYTDVIVRISDTERGEYETIKITNMQSEVESALYDILSHEENEWNGNVLDYLEQKGFDYVPIMKSGGLNDGYPQFYDFDVDMAAREVYTASELPATKQAEQLINRMEFHRTVFDSEERNLIMNHAYKLDNMADTTALAYSIAEQKDDISLLMETENMAQAEIDALPDGMNGLSEMHGYGYTWNEMLPLTKEKALELFEHDLPLYVLHEDGSETMVEDKTQIQEHEGIFGIERGDWENERNLRAMQEELSENEAGKETQLLYGSTDKYGIYQLKDNPELRPFHFAGTEALKRMGITKDNFDAVKRENYNLIYVGELSELQRQTQGATLEAVYEKFNIDHPADYKGHSLSVSDIVVLHQDGENTAHFVDSFGFTTLPEFLKEQAPELEAVQEEMQDTSGQDVQKPDLEEEKESPMVYRQSLSHAVEHGEKDLYRASWKLDIECKEAVEEAIRQNFDGMHLNTGAVKPLMEKYGSERIAFVLANTIQQEAWDGRFSRDNKAWASEFSIPENMANGIDLNRELIVSSHPAVLDGFVDMFRKEVMELEKEAAQDIAPEEMQDTSGQDVQKPEPENVEDGDEIIDLGDEKEQVLAEMKKAQEKMQDTFGQSVQKPEMEDKEEPHETELAFQIADRYITIQEVEDGYDYSIMGADYKEIDGGVYDNPDVGIREALHDIVEDLKSEPDYNGAKGNIREDDELIPMDYDELMEKAEAANRIQLQNTQSSVVADFKAKTDELFHDISEMNPSEIEETVKCHVQAKIEEYDIDAQIEDVAVVGSRCRGLEREGSDLDVVVELSTREREDDLFNAFNNSDGIYIGDIKVDINPITTQRTGSLENYLPQVEEYLESVRQAREQEPKSIFGVRMFNEERFFENTSGMDAEALCKAYAECEKPFVEMRQYGKQIDMGEFASIQQGERMSFSVEFDADNDEIIISDGEHFEHKGLAETLFPEQKEKEAEVTLLVSECSEFHNYGEFYENIPTVDEAIAIWRQIPPERLNAIPAIGINLHVPGTEPFEDSEVDILSGKRIDLEILDHIPDIKNSPQAMEVIAQLVAKMPEMEIDGVMSEEMEARVWELRMPDLGLTGQLAVELDRFVHDYDTYSYRNDVHSMTENVTELTEMLEQGDTEHITEWLNEAISEGTAPEEEERAKELLEKLAEYKPLAKIEEMEEQNYNMVDNVLNNGAGEKAQKEAAKKEQEQPAARVSLKARLSEKKALISGQGKDHETQENIKNNQREM